MSGRDRDSPNQEYPSVNAFKEVFLSNKPNFWDPQIWAERFFGLETKGRPNASLSLSELPVHKNTTEAASAIILSIVKS